MAAITGLFKAPKVPAPVQPVDDDKAATVSAGQLRRNVRREQVDTLLSTGGKASSKRNLLGGG